MLLSSRIDPFSVDAVRDFPPTLLPVHSTWDGFQFEKSLESNLLRLNDGETEALPAFKAGVFQLNLEDVPLPDLAIAASIPTSDSEDDYFDSLEGEDEEDPAVDVWILPDIHRRKLHLPLASWDAFLHKSHWEPTSAYLSEAQPDVFNAVLQASNKECSRYVKPDILLHACADLCMGRESILFTWDEKKNTFVAHWQNIASRGYTSVLVQSCFEEFSTTGSMTRYLEALVQKSIKSSEASDPLPVAFLSACRSILHAVDREMCTSIVRVTSMLQLRGRMSKVRTILEVLHQCHKAVDTQQPQHKAITRLIRETGNASLNHRSLAGMMQLLFLRTFSLLLTQLSVHIGLCQPVAPLEEHRSTEAYDQELWTVLLGLGPASMIQEARKSLRFLRKHSRNCPVLATRHTASIPAHGLDLGFTFEAVSNLQARATSYEESMRTLIASTSRTISTNMHDASAAEDLESRSLIPQTMLASPFQLEVNLFDDQQIQLKEEAEDELQLYVTSLLRNQSSEEPTLPIELEDCLALSTTPLVSAQHRLLSYSVLQMLSHDHDLLGHLRIQRNFHMLGSAFFSSRLRAALFDSSQTSGEGYRKTGASTGLRLEARDSWPPAGSELRLVLMSILSDSLDKRDRALEDTISLAIRDLPPDELERCRNVDSIHALDFLRLQYTAPNDVLEAIFTPQILDKYDRIFQHLLLTMRLHAVTQDMLRSDAGRERGRFRDHTIDKIVVEMHHFIVTVADYSHNIAIESCWGKFQDAMHNAKTHVDHQRYEETLRTVQGLDHLHALQESTLDRILRALLLKRKQAKCRQILESIYTTILAFSAERRKKFQQSASFVQDDAVTVESSMKRLGQDFRHQVGQFLEALRSDKQAIAESPELDGVEELEDSGKEVDMFEHLLLRLDMSGYWSRQRGRGTRMWNLPMNI